MGKPLILAFLWCLAYAKQIFKNPYEKVAPKTQDIQIFEDTSNAFTICGVKGFSGYATVEKQYGSALYYMYTEAVKGQAQATVIWLQGGPGGSSLFGALDEFIGPFQIKSDGKTPFKIANSWGNRYALLFIDQPVGTGYSTPGSGPLRTSTWESAQDFEVALENIQKMHPEWFQRDLFIFGESYGGHYIPTYAYTMLKSGKWPMLKGIGIGDGLHDGYSQLTHYADLLFSIGFITVQEKEIIEQYQQSGRLAIENSTWVEASAAFDKILAYAVQASGGVNVYNARQWNYVEPPYSSQWLNLNTTKRMLGVPQEKTWIGSSDQVYQAYTSDIAKPFVSFFDNLLQNMRVLLYCGQDDIIINVASWEEFVKALEWYGADEFKALDRQPWYIGDIIGGYSKWHANLTQLIILNSGHMVPLDQPEVSREMLRMFVENIAWP